MTTFACSRCSREHANLRALRIHEARHRRDDAKPKAQKLPYACPWCDLSYDAGKKLTIHCTRTHNKSPVEVYNERFPDCRTHCTSCESPVKFIDQDKGYPELCPTCSRSEAYKTNGFVPWNKGKTKNDDVAVAVAASKMRDHYATNGHHMTGRTSENDDVIKMRTEKVKRSLTKHYETNDGWSLGLTKETSEIIARRAKRISESLTGKPLSLQHIEALRRAKTLHVDNVIERFKKHGFKLIDDYEHSMKHLNIECITCGNKCKKTLHATLHGSKCPTCYPPWADKTSRWQKEIYEFVCQFAPDATMNDRTTLNGLELDVYVPSQRFAIECNGLYWHSAASERFVPHHAEKKRLAAVDAGVKLLTIFEDEWRDRRQVVMSMIRHRLKASRPVHARKLTLSTRQPREVKDNIEQWHLEGNVNSTYAFSLDDHGDMIGAMTLRWSRRSDKKVLEIARMAFKSDYVVVGGVTRFIKAAAQLARQLGATDLISYSDNRLGSGDGYLSAGMKLLKTTVERFWWTDFSRRYDRFKFRADSSRGLSERDVAAAAGVHRIYGCSNSLWSLTV